MVTSRISRRKLQQSKKKLIYAVAGIIIVLILLFTLGIPLLIKFSLSVSGGKQGGDAAAITTAPSFIAPPVLNPYASATNSAQISISGSASSKQPVTLYVNNKVVTTQTAKDDGSFTFDSVTLMTGDNTITAKAKEDTKESDFSNTITVTYENKAPSLDVSSPSDGQNFAKDPAITVKGKTDPDAKVTVNDFQAIVDDSGNFSYDMQLQNGDNQLKIVAFDAAGNKTEKDVKVTYSP